MAVTGLAALLAGYALWFDSYARNESILRYSDYGFYGLQMGSPQLFTWIKQNSDRFTSFCVGTNLFNMGDVFAWFFLPQRTLKEVRMVDLDDVCRGRLAWPQGVAFLFPAGFPAGARSAGCPLGARVLFTVADPLGHPVMMAGSLVKEPGFDAWVSEQDKRSRLPVTETAVAYGHVVTVEHPPFDIGSAADLFDGNSSTIARAQQVNPARYEIRFRGAQHLKKVGVEFANTTEADVTVTTNGPTGDLCWGRQHYSRSRGDAPALVFRMAAPTAVSAITIDVHLTDQGQFGFVHLSGLTWR